MMPAIDFAGAKKSKTSVLLFFCAGDKKLKILNRRGAEFNFVSSACGAVNNTKFFSAPQRLCGEKLLTLSNENQNN